MKTYCPTCNRSSDEARFFGEFCEHCTADKLKKRIKDQITMYRCKRCGDVLVRGSFRKFSMDSLSELLDSELHAQGCSARAKSFHGNMAMVDLDCQIDGRHLRFEKAIGITVKHRICDRDYKISAGYYETLLQLRGGAERVAKVADKVSEYVAKRGGFVAKRIESRNGIDIYLSDKRAVDDFILMKRLKPHRSYKLHTERAGKKIYRNIYSLRLD